jgi:hypothetical protein
MQTTLKSLKKLQMEAGAAADIKDFHVCFRPEHPDPKQSKPAIHWFKDLVVQPGNPAIRIHFYLLLRSLSGNNIPGLWLATS